MSPISLHAFVQIYVSPAEIIALKDWVIKFDAKPELASKKRSKVDFASLGSA